ncbi:MAG TPA: hypothetical protein PKE29_09110 [Phycisphaerales bacterium]|nr:hypothetical protein [Phycisphaerales bacterium]
MTFRAHCALAAAGLAALASSSSFAAITLTNGQSVNLDVVLASNDRQVNIGDKTFTFESYTSSSFVPSTISVTAFVSANPLQGTGFDLTGGFGDINPNDANISEFNVRYTVEVMPAFAALGYRITDLGLVFNGAATGTGSYARVDESVFDVLGIPGQNLVTSTSAFVYGSGTPAAQLQSAVVWGPPGYVKIEVNKDVQFFATNNGSSSASFVRQTFSQIPTPGAMGLIGLAGMFIARRKRA